MTAHKAQKIADLLVQVTELIDEERHLVWLDNDLGNQSADDMVDVLFDLAYQFNNAYEMAIEK